ncbi:hypothetical protein LCI18_014780 [Fusarium solani-melongenae]|uniref:Uncharacterized protein n=1 Tax=Fusarium solani subsp. cucurbitae TaxID=2747967 RepID=A0ACD3ZRJ3_FUSSC|nr:hypothetical protein LCI18_014780 [Fusarium solani-melongenae]
MADSYGESSLCTTPACIHIASEILGNFALNYTEIDPCTDFDQYVCGNWAARNEIPAGQTRTNGISVTRDFVLSAVKRILESPYPTGKDAGWITVNLTKEQSRADKENFAKIQDAYNVCMNYTAIEEEDLSVLSAFVETVVDVFPAIEESGKNETHDYSKELGETLVLFESLGIETTQRFVHKQNEIDPDEVLLVIIPPSTVDIPGTEEGILEYLDLASALIAAVHPAKPTIKEAYALMSSVVKLQVKMLKVFSRASEDDNPNELSPLFRIEDIQKLAPQLNYEYVVKELAPKGYRADKVAFSTQGYYKELSDVISETPAEVIQTFFVWKAITALSPYVETELTNAWNAFFQKQLGKDPESPAPRWQRCVDFLDSGVEWVTINPMVESLVGPTGLTWILSRFFVDKYYPPEAHNLTSQLVDSLELAFLERLETRDWPTDETKTASAEKLHAMTNKIGLPTDPNAVDPVAINKYYDGAEVTSSYVANALSFAKVNIAKNWESLGKPFDRGQFEMSTLAANAYQDFQLNAIVLLAGFQQFPVYDVDFPSYLLYGGMGSVVGHEITHGFDNTGRLFDATGNMTTWWDKESIAAFENKTECFIEQYNKFTITAPNGTQLHVDGELTLGENIADAGGVVSSFLAWQKWEKEKGPAKSLPGLHDFTGAQLFFVKWGQTFCKNIPAEDQVRLLSEDVHSPNDARIMLTLQNSAGFLKAFDCPQKKPTCELW